MKNPDKSERSMDWSLYVDHTIHFRENHTLEDAYQGMFRFGVDYAALINLNHEPIGLISIRQLAFSFNTEFGKAIFGRKLLGEINAPLVTPIEDAIVFNSMIHLAKAHQMVEQLLDERKHADIIGLSETGLYVGMISIRDFVRRENKVLRKDREALKSQLDELSHAFNDLAQPGSELVNSERDEARAELAEGIEKELLDSIEVIATTQGLLEEALPGFAPKVSSERAKQLAHRLQTNIEMSREAITRLAQLSRGLNLMSSEDGRTPEVVNLGDLVTRVLIQLASKFKSNVLVHTDIGEREFFACFPNQMAHLLLNLLNQTHRIMRGKGEIAIEVAREPKYLEITIRYLPKLSQVAEEEATEQASKDLDDYQEIDLTLPRRIVEGNHGGAITALVQEGSMAGIVMKFPCGTLLEMTA